MEERKEEYSEQLTRLMTEGNVGKDVTRWLGEFVEKQGLGALSFFIDANSTKAVSGRIFFNVSPGSGARTQESISACTFKVSPELVDLIGSKLIANPQMAKQVLFDVAEYLSNNTNIREVCDAFNTSKSHSYVRESQDKKFGANVGAGDALYNLLIAQSAYNIIEVALRESNKQLMGDELLVRNLERIKQIKSRIRTIEALMVHPDNQGSKGRRTRDALQREKKEIQAELDDLLKDPRNKMDVNTVLQALRVLVNKNAYNHTAVEKDLRISRLERDGIEKLNQAKSNFGKSGEELRTGHRVDPDAWGSPKAEMSTPPGKAVSDRVTAKEKAEYRQKGEPTVPQSTQSSSSRLINAMDLSNLEPEQRRAKLEEIRK